MVEAVSQLEKDSSEVGKKIRERMSKRAREWFKDMKNQRELVTV
jgi:hypothetical protein